MNIKLYHETDVITVHPSKLKEMESNGWSQKQPTNKKTTTPKPAK